MACCCCRCRCCRGCDCGGEGILDRLRWWWSFLCRRFGDCCCCGGTGSPSLPLVRFGGDGDRLGNFPLLLSARPEWLLLLLLLFLEVLGRGRLNPLLLLH